MTPNRFINVQGKISLKAGNQLDMNKAFVDRHFVRENERNNPGCFTLKLSPYIKSRGVYLLKFKA